MADKKVVFVAFAIEDERQRDFLKGQSLLTKCPFEYVDMSVKQAYDADWRDRIRTRIRRSDGVIVLVSKNCYIQRPKMGDQLRARGEEEDPRNSCLF